MAANLTAQYRKAEETYRRATTPEDELRCLQVMLRELPKHKGTDKLQADLKQKISQAKKVVATQTSSKKAGLRIPRQGAGRVVLIGAPNSGRSQFVSATSRASPEVADYPFTTREILPAMMLHEDVLIQLIDSPPVTADYLDADLLGLIRGADIVLLLCDLSVDDGWQQCQEVIDHLNMTRTRLAADSRLDADDIGVSFTRTFVVYNKSDADDAPIRLSLFRESQEKCLPAFREFQISAKTGKGIEALKTAIFLALDVIRVYTKSPTRGQPDFEKPFTLRRGSTLAEVAELIHKDLAANLKSARVWGSVVHDGTTVKSDYVLQDKDIVEIKTG